MKLLILPVLLLATSTYAAGIQKWVDESGQTHYGDSPPAAVQSESIRVTRPPSDPGPKLPRLGTGETGDQATAEPDAAAPQQAAEPEAEPENQEQAYCQRARKDLQVISRSKRIRLQATDGTSRYMTDEEIAARKSQAQADVERYCQ